MKIEKKYSKIAVGYTYGKMLEAGVKLDPTILDSYKSVLKVMAANKKYAEGQQLDNEDVERIKSNIGVLINDAIKKHDADSLDFVKEHTSPHQYIIGAYLYLTALAMDELNCPELPKNMGKDMFEKATRRLIETRPPMQSAEEYFNKQRRKDFLDISDGIFDLINKVNENKKDHKSLAELYGQYRALSERQANHTGIWRFFHREENENRNELLKLMENTLKQRLPGGTIDLSKEPNTIYQDSLYNDYIKRINTLSDLLEIRAESEQAYGYQEYKQNPKLFEEYQKRESIQEQKEQKKESVQEQEQEQQKLDQDQQELIDQLTEDLAKDSNEPLSKIDPPKTEARTKTIN